MLSHATTKVGRLIKMVGVNIQHTPHGDWQTSLYTTFYSGGNLANYLTQYGSKLTKEKLQKMCTDVLSMLEQLRSYGIMHRDFKADNIVVS